MIKRVSSANPAEQAAWDKLLTPAEIPAKWRKILLRLPGYDAIATAGNCRFDPEEAQRALDFFPRYLKHMEGEKAGQPFELEPWQASIIANLFGWMRVDSKGRICRRYREVLIYVPRKNGKTPLAAGIAAYVFFCDGERGQQNYIAASDREQAGMLFRQLKGMVEQEPDLLERARIYGGNASAGQSRSLVRESDASFVRVVAADADKLHGGVTHVAVIDELHAQPNRDMVDVFETSLSSLNRRSPLIAYLTTSDFDRPSICNEKWQHACMVRDGLKVDDYFLPVVYEAKPGDPWDSEQTWKACNPNYGISKSEDYFLRAREKAKTDVAFRNTFKRLDLNIRTSTVEGWIDLGAWDKCGKPFDRASLKGMPCYIGIDWGWRNDYMALVALVVDGTHFYSLPYFWIPRDTKRNLFADPTATFIANELLLTTEGDDADLQSVYEKVADLSKEFDLQQIAVDAKNANAQEQYFIHGYGKEKVFAFGQNKTNYTPPCKLLTETLLPEKRFHHGMHPVLRWMAGNTVPDYDNFEQLMPRKKISAEKIDGICAMLMALARAMLHKEAPTGCMFVT